MTFYPNVLVPLKSLLLFVFILTACKSSKQKQQVQEVLAIKSEAIVEHSIEPNYDIDIRYPQIIGMEDTTIQSRLNRQIYTDILNQLQLFKKDIQQSFQADAATFSQQKSHLKINFQTGIMHKDLISFSTTTNQRNAAAAHPSHIENSYNFAPKTGERVSITDLFAPGTNYLDKLSAYTAAAIVEQKNADDLEADPSMIAAATAPRRQSFNTFVVKDDHISIYYYYYAVSQYREPDVWIDIPFSDLSSYISATGPLGFTLQATKN